MSLFDRAFEEVILIEGGYSNDPDDSGGATRWGITEQVARAHGYTGPMRDLPVSEARRIYKAAYWKQMRLPGIAKLSPEIAFELFEAGIHAGTVRPVTWFQRLLNVMNRRAVLWADMHVDGKIGPVTRAALRSYLEHRGTRGEMVLYTALNALQAEFLITLAEKREKDEKWIYGWLDRRIARGISRMPGGA